MRLSDLKDIVHMDIIRDGGFGSRGYLRHHMERMLVALFDRAFRAELNSVVARKARCGFLGGANGRHRAHLAPATMMVRPG